MYDSIIESAAKEYKVHPTLIKAIIKVESNWNPKTYRKEPRINDTSWGLMQVLLKTARKVSNNPSLSPEQLVQPTVNIMIGTKYLSILQNKYPSLDDVIASYNAGKPKKLANGNYVNQAYVNKVKRAMGLSLHSVLFYTFVLGAVGFFLVQTQARS